MRVVKPLLLLLPVVLLVVSCQKEIEIYVPPVGGGGGGGGGGQTGNCNNTVKKLKRWQATFDSAHYISAEWNGDGTIKWIKLNVPLSDYLTAHFNYSNGKISQAISYQSDTYALWDTAVFRYNSDGLVDSMYLKNSGRDLRLHYTNGKLVKVSRLEPGGVMYYYNVTTDANGNVTKAEEYWENGSGGFDKESTFTYTRDAKKNPLAALAPYLLYLDDEYQAFWYWGPSNMTDQRYQDHTGTGIDITTGHKFKYDANCYPVSSQQTIMGQPLFPDDDFLFTYW